MYIYASATKFWHIFMENEMWLSSCSQFHVYEKFHVYENELR